MKKIKLSFNNTLISFLFRSIIFLLISTIFWIGGVFYYYENDATQKIHTLIEQKKNLLKDQIKYFHPNNEQIKASILRELQKNDNNFHISAIKVYRKKQLIIDHIEDEIPVAIKQNFNNNIIVDDGIKEGIFIHDDINERIYMLSKISDENSDVKVLIKLNEQMKKLIKSDIYETLFVAIFSIIFSNLFMFPIFYRQYKTVLEKEKDLLHSNISTLNALGNAVSKRDSDTDEHNYRVTLYSVKLAEKIGLNKQAIKELIKGAFLHDVGKIGIQDSILLKPGKLTKDEFSVMKTHVNHGIEIVEGTKWLEGAKPVISCHHEKYDGSGYPQGLAGENIPIEARVFAVVDVFDALTSKRPYKEPFTVEKSIEILLDGSDSHFDKEILEHFISLCSTLHAESIDKNKKQLEEILYTAISPYFNF